ncbi:S-methyl-5-thioribose-1-phosphate isomerase [Candidatus Woesearchaeota archaeon]|nr:S-methyl-5-thioribose-1-phosphate isomerase [Candidatus Woesearchaeota archaeon]
MKVNDKHYRTVWMEGSNVKLIEQNLLPFEFEIYTADDYIDTCAAIQSMQVRGAGAIGATAGYAMAQAFLESLDTGATKFWNEVEQAKKTIESTRPTAQNLFYATNRVFDAGKQENNIEDSVRVAVEQAQKIADEDAAACKKIGEYGAELIKLGFRIGTHCNAGWLAFVDNGSALSPIYVAHRNGIELTVYADETRPRSQGARLTARELYNENVNHFIVPDNAMPYLMSRGEIDMFIVGSDRIAANGDVANKIGTMGKAIAAKRFGVPFYVAAPTSTIDLNCSSGSKIPIEQRSQDEVLYQTGIDEDGFIQKILVCSPGSKAINPAFDITPAELITGIITEKGIVKPNVDEIKNLFS